MGGYWMWQTVLPHRQPDPTQTMSTLWGGGVHPSGQGVPRSVGLIYRYHLSMFYLLNDPPPQVGKKRFFSGPGIIFPWKAIEPTKR